MNKQLFKLAIKFFNGQIVLLNFLLVSSLISAQVLPSSRSTDWTKAGIRVPPPVYTDTINFSGDNTGGSDVSGTLQTLLNGLTEPTVIQFLAGTYLFESQITVPSQVVIKGLGADVTIFNFDLGRDSASCFEVIGTKVAADFNKTVSAISVGDTVLTQTYSPVYSGLAVGNYIQLIQNDGRLTNNQTKYTGQISRVVALTATTITLEDEVRLEHPTAFTPRFAHIDSPKQHVGFECFTINRLDTARSETTFINKVAKFSFSYATNCWLKGVRSFKCNGAHVRAEYSAHLQISDCYFNDAFGYGGGGQAYGVNLLLATSQCRVENNIFENLRHSMLVHYGANANVFAYNYSFNTRDEFGPGSEDLVCHGNYPYLNLFESNVAYWGAVDNAAGANGPYNTYFRNRLTRSSKSIVTINGFWISNSASDQQNVIGNHTAGSPAQLRASDHQIEYNSWPGQSTTGTLETSLAYAEKPDFLESNEFGAIGYPNFNVSTNPAADRVNANSLFENSCGATVYRNNAWSFGTPSTSNYEQMELVVDTNESLVLNTAVSARSFHLRPGASVDFQNSPSLTDSLYFEADTVNGYSQSLGTISEPVVYEQIISEPGWHIISSPVAGFTVADLGEEIILNFADKGQDCNLYTWDGTTAEYTAVVDGTQSLDQTALYFFVSDIFIKSGAGINENGQLPVKLRFRGSANQGNVTGPTLGLGRSNHAAGSDAVGWNLIPNPYPSSLDLDVVFATVPANYQPGAQVWDPSTETYEVRSTSALANGNPAAIAPGQAFFVKLDPSADTASGFYDFTNTDRTIAKSPVFKKAPVFGAVLDLKSAKGAQKLYVHFNEAGSFLKGSTDLSRFFNPAGKIAQWGTVKWQADTARFMAIGQYPMATKGLEVPLYFSTPRDSSYLVIADSVSLPEGLQLRLVNKEKGWSKPLTHGPVELNLPQGKSSQVYALLITDALKTSANPFDNIYRVNQELWAEYPKDLAGQAELLLFDLQGRLLMETGPFNRQGWQRFTLPQHASGIYILQHKAASKSTYQKIYLP